MCRPGRLAALAAGAALLAGCAGSGPASELELEIPASWTAERPVAEGPEPASPAEPWWEEFGDFRLGALVEEALENNRDLQAAAARLEQARQRARIAGADLLPQAGLAADASRLRRNFIGFPIPGGDSSVLSTTSTSLGVALNVSWEADLWGRLRAGRRAAVADHEAARLDLEAARTSLAAQTAKAWFTLLEAEAQQGLAAETLENRTFHRERIRRRYELGLRPALDLRLARSGEAAAAASLALRQRRLDAARRQLELLLGRYPAAGLGAAGGLPAAPPPLAAGLPAELITRRPDLAAAERRLAAAGARVEAARAALFPALRLTGSAGRASEEVEDLLRGDFSVWSLAAGILQPIFQGGRLRAGVELAGAGADEALARYAQASLQAFAEVETALAAEASLRRQREALNEAVEQSTAAQRLAEQRYGSGLAEYLEVLESQRQAAESQGQLLEVQRLQLANRVDLHLALGGSLLPASAGPPPSGDEGR